MADADPVDITVQIKNRFSDQIETLKGELASIQDKIEADLEINDNGEIDWAQMELEALEQIIEAVLDIDTSDISETKAKLQALDGTHTQSTHEVDVHRDGDQFDPPNLGDRELGGIQQMDFTQDDLIQRLIRGDTQKTIPNLRGISDTTETGKISERWMNRIPDSPSPYDRSNTDFGEFEIPSVATETIHQAEDYDTSLGGKSAHMSAAEDVTADKFRAKEFEIDGKVSGDVGDALNRIAEDDWSASRDISLGDPRMNNYQEIVDGLNSPDRLDSHNGIPDPRSNIMAGSGIDFPDNAEDLMESLGHSSPEYSPDGDMDMGNMANRVVPNTNIGSDEKESPLSKLIPDGNPIDEISDGLGDLDSKLKKAFPSMRKWMNLVAALIPMLIALAPALLGVAAAMGTVAAAGAGMIGLGLLGFDNLQQRLQEFTSEIAGVFDPVMNEFRPIADMFLDVLPNALTEFATALSGLKEFEGTFMGGVMRTITLFENLIGAAVELEPIISQLSKRFGDFVADGVVDAFRFFITEAASNQDAIMNMVDIFGNLLATLYNLSIAVSKIVIEFQPLFNILRFISELINSDLLTGLGASIAKVLLLTKAVTGTVAAVKALTAAMAKNPLTLAAIGATWALSEMGAFDFMLGGSGPGNGVGNNGFNGNVPTGGASGRPGSSGGDTYVMQVDGNARDEHMEQFKDMAETRDYWQESENNARNPNSSDSE